MAKFYMTNEAFGCDGGPIESESKESLADEMMETFRIWSRDRYYKLIDCVEIENVSLEEYVDSDVVNMRREFIECLEEA